MAEDTWLVGACTSHCRSGSSRVVRWVEDGDADAMSVNPRGEVFETDADVERELWTYAPVVLHVTREVPEVDVIEGLKAYLAEGAKMALGKIRHIVARDSVAVRIVGLTEDRIRPGRRHVVIGDGAVRVLLLRLGIGGPLIKDAGSYRMLTEQLGD